MSENSSYEDKDLINEPAADDPLGQIHSSLVTPDIAEINEDAAELRREKEAETDKL
ncbi:hypothetical protein ACFUCV_03980 [Specibacter sp. NPDC057265]|uniref:hypothetical protein n=1 Tax=Specibacter sp. NPDC057265 TaxID=3346075 RepID=UPI0036289844